MNYSIAPLTISVADKVASDNFDERSEKFGPFHFVAVFAVVVVVKVVHF